MPFKFRPRASDDLNHCGCFTRHGPISRWSSWPCKIVPPYQAFKQGLQSFSPADWEKLLRDAGLEVESVLGFFPARHVIQWSLLSFTPLRAISVLKLVPLPALHRAAAALERRLLRSRFLRTPSAGDPETAAALLIRAHSRSDV